MAATGLWRRHASSELFTGLRVTFWERSHARFARFLKLPWLHNHAQDRYFRVLRGEITPGVRWLDLGCGHQLVPDWAAPVSEQRAVAARARYLAGADVDVPALRSNPFVRHRIVSLGDHLPFADDSFDFVSANMVVEHLAHPEPIFREIFRVLSSGGRFLFHTPNRLYPYIFLATLIPDGIKVKIIWLLERRADVDVFKTYYQANTVKQICALAARTNFEVTHISVGGSVGVFGLIGPLGLLELPFLKLLTLRPLNRFNATIITILTKPGRSSNGDTGGQTDV